MNETEIRTALRQLDHIEVAPAIPPETVTRARTRRMWSLATATSVVLVTVASVVFAGSMLSGQTTYAPPPVAPGRSPAVLGTAGGWHVEISVAPPEISPLAISVSDPRPAEQNDAQPWLQHDLVFENRGDDPVRFDDTRTSVLLENALLAADEGCGYGRLSPTSPIEAGACNTYLDNLIVRPGRAETRTVTLFKELDGMAPLTGGSYVFARPIRFRVGSGDVQEAELRITYTITRAGEGSATPHTSPTAPTSEASGSPGDGEPFRLLVHCGLSYPLEFDGRLWLPVDPELRKTINPPPGIRGDGIYDEGTIRTVDQDTIVYTSSGGIEVEYEPTVQPRDGCD